MDSSLHGHSIYSILLCRNMHFTSATSGNCLWTALSGSNALLGPFPLGEDVTAQIAFRPIALDSLGGTLTSRMDQKWNIQHTRYFGHWSSNDSSWCFWLSFIIGHGPWLVFPWIIMTHFGLARCWNTISKSCFLTKIREAKKNRSHDPALHGTASLLHLDYRNSWGSWLVKTIWIGGGSVIFRESLCWSTVLPRYFHTFDGK